MKHRNSDPSSNRNVRNKSTRAGVAGAAFVALALLGAVTDSSKPVTRQAVEAAKAPETARDALNTRMQNTTIAFASAINALYSRDGKNTEKFTWGNSEEKGAYTIGVKIGADTTAGGDYGEYFMSADFKKDAHGNPDLTTATGIFIGMDNRKNGEDPEPGYGNFYGFELVKVNFDGVESWRVIHHSDGKLGDGPVIFNSTEPEAGNGSSVLQPIDMDGFNRLARQAADVVTAASQGKPVSYPSPA